jgi:hypothetical protein
MPDVQDPTHTIKHLYVTIHSISSDNERGLLIANFLQDLVIFVSAVGARQAVDLDLWTDGHGKPIESACDLYGWVVQRM